MTETIVHEVGGNIEARCAKCKAITGHEVLGLKRSGSAKTVRCVPCGYEHAYRQPRVKKTAAERAAAKPTAAEKKQAKADAEFDEMMSGVSPEDSILYDMSTSFNLDDIMEHPIFGLGKVKELITPDKAVVQFREGPKVLVCVISTGFPE